MFISWPRHFLTMANYCSQDNNTFAVENMLAMYTWGEKRPLSSSTPYLCNSANCPITVWVLGSLTETTLLSVDPTVKMHGVAVTPITQGTSDDTKCLLGRLKSPISSVCLWSLDVFHVDFCLGSFGDWSNIWSIYVMWTMKDRGEKVRAIILVIWLWLLHPSTSYHSRLSTMDKRNSWASSTKWPRLLLPFWMLVMLCLWNLVCKGGPQRKIKQNEIGLNGVLNLTCKVFHCYTPVSPQTMQSQPRNWCRSGFEVHIS